ncbi:hypothetical protein [Bifidobacterium dentium]|uniref:hypothetical protein n=1 Tax=Bifidobacterium dentium TaxID=1689 RepID=UPI0018B0321B|nr:hypothetical protein [Bifidobacterium dentium]MBF9694397.1 hypothetical protein [Bifidobacterium dentium]
MSAMDPEDALDQLLNSTWSNMAQQLGTLHRSLSADVQQRNRERKAWQAQQARLQAADIREMEAQRARLLSWESAHRRELNNGFESVLNATVLGTKGCAPLSDTSLLKAWNVSEMLVGTDPGYAARLSRARDLMDAEWSARHPGETIGQQADRVMNNVTITYVDRTPALEDTLAAFEKAGFTVSLDREDTTPDEFKARHDGETFRVDPESGEGWNGQRNDLIADCVMMQAVVSVDEAGQRISYLRDAGLPESSGGDNRSEGDEPSSLFEGSMNENENAAPASGRPEPSESETDTEERDGTHAGGGETDAASAEMPVPEKRKRRAVESETGGDLSSSEATGEDRADPVDLYGPEEWDGPDLFGEYSPEQEASMASTMPSVPAAEPSLPDVSITEQADRRNAR